MGKLILGSLTGVVARRERLSPVGRSGRKGILLASLSLTKLVLLPKFYIRNRTPFRSQESSGTGRELIILEWRADKGGCQVKKYRDGKIKREHSVIERLWPLLERMAECDLVTSIIPGPISPLNGKGFEITFQRFTETGLRLLAKNGSAVQEVYVVAPQKETALRWLAGESLVVWEPEPDPTVKPRAVGAAAAPAPLKTVVLPSDMACGVCGRLMTAGSRAVRLGRKNYNYVHVRCAK
jgi:hypothetical protein